MKTNLKTYLLLFIVIGSLLASCSKGGIDPDNGGNNSSTEQKVSNDNSLRNFAFLKSSNTTLANNCTGVADGTTIYISVPDGVSLETLVPSFSVHEKATVHVGSTTVQGGTTQIDFTKTVDLTVTSESGSKRIYTILAKNCNPDADNKVYSFMIKHGIPGVSVSISKDEEIVYSAGYGFADKDTRERVTPDHMFRLASMSKQHAAIAIMTLVEQGKLKLTDTVFGKDGILHNAFGDNMHSSWKTIAVEHLLSHTSGILTDCIFGSSTYAGKDINGRISLLLQNAKVEYTPGTVHKYNNTNFGILGKIVEVITGKSFMKYLQDDIYTPLGITGIDAGNNDAPKKGEVNYYGQDGKNPYGNDVEAGVAAGGVIASTPALMKLMAHLDYGTKVKDIFKKETLDRMYTPIDVVDIDGDAFDQYALGWRINYDNYPDWDVLHGGTLAGVSTIWARSYDNVNGVVLCNSRSYNKSIDPDMWHMLEDIQDMYRK